MTAPPATIARFVEARGDADLAIVEGFHALKHAIRFEAEIVDAITEDSGKSSRLAQLLAPDVVAPMQAKVRRVAPGTLASISPEPPNPPDVVTIAVRQTAEPHCSAPSRWDRHPAERPTQLGNIGAVVRRGRCRRRGSGCHDRAGSRPLAPAPAIRGSAGLHFALAVSRWDQAQLDAFLAATHPPLVALDPRRRAASTGLVCPTRHAGVRQRAQRDQPRTSGPQRSGGSRSRCRPWRHPSLNLATAVPAAWPSMSGAVRSRARDASSTLLARAAPCPARRQP